MDVYPFSSPAQDRPLEYDILKKRKLNCTLIALPLIEFTNERRAIKTSIHDCIGGKISATDLAHFLIEQLEDTIAITKVHLLSNI
ncbi:MAG: hypothetical protein HKN31_14065 [Pricia sp.]|nr:hypothetical protein [Pricia sp.]